jgi:hypothetical protein
MKSIMIIAALLVSGLAHAEGAASAPAAPAAKKMSKSAAKAACKKEDKTLKGDALKECVAKKQM